MTRPPGDPHRPRRTPPAGGRPAAPRRRVGEPRRSGDAAAPRPARPRPSAGQGRPAARPRPRPDARRPGPPRRPPAGPRSITLADPKRRLRLVTVCLGLVFAIFAGRLVQLQLLDSDALAAAAGANKYVRVALPAERGTITAADGTVLATSVDAYDITADPTMFTPEATHLPDAPEQAAALLAPILGQPKEKLAAALHLNAKNPKSQYALLTSRQTPQAKGRIADLKSTLTKQADTAACRGQRELLGKAPEKGGRQFLDTACVNPLAGVFWEQSTRRSYPANGLAANLVGFVNSEGTGTGGLELQYQQLLAGQDGYSTYASAAGRRVATAGGSRQDAVPGSDLRLTVDPDIQWAAQRAITDQVTNAGAEKGYVIVQDVKTGQVLAMAASPGFNPNDLASARADQLGNPALQDAYEPGSTAKLMTMAAVLDTGSANWDTHVTVPNTLQRADRVFHDDVDHETWYLTLAGVLAKSSNIGTIEAAEHLGATQAEANKVLAGYLDRFGIGKPTGLGFPGETRGILAKPEDWNGSQQYTIPFGQGLSVNALQATSVFSTIANGGVRVAPSLLAGTTGPDGRYTPAPAGEQSRVVTESTAKTLTEMLESVVTDEQGTGTKAQIPGYRVAGKTGTANRVDPKTGKYSGYTASFIGFAPADQPRVTVSCVIQDPVNGHFGGQLCGPVFKQVMEFTLKSLQVPPSGSEAPNLPVDWKP
ncbi:peptidoglycan D,D-transpeptidase FtsI family protein [Kitasatospora cheerisanensis]|uniref:Cell division protein n=1 Tax=Kitasatospora cheerisanensis KCTC 2395 TaxID=1348663 RepID=A0A066Z279_9ACTN|nr:penicillin-binding protein 2 [Kitasatospora cheerisanensis]KDN86344.1 cell division protein [Kitasatospora cheerisanensis KCTC 2395]